MDRSARFSLKRMCAMLCVVLALAFAGASATRIVDRIQHQPGGPADHTHLPFSDIAYDADDHYDDHAGTDDQDNGANPDHQPGPSHHHHGDSGSGLPVLAAAETVKSDLGADRHDLRRDRAPPGLSTYGPERPPKHNMISV
ncbi:hypothetical protein [uncultured Sphingobium sp.]|uniref:hypothetical protein n=1 Tax=uncultured Sphingobium sp. TaxID=316087 RepID=UPI00258EAAA8|nr:hypothetical protein [uncultured Sphingobium sp.]